jgi:hypothetical protein
MTLYIFLALGLALCEVFRYNPPVLIILIERDSMALYHSEVYMPQDIISKIPTGIIQLRHTRHSELSARSDRYGHIIIAGFLNLESDNAKLIEAEYNNGRLVKFVVRCDYIRDVDIIYVLIPERGYYTVKTRKPTNITRWIKIVIRGLDTANAD